MEKPHCATNGLIPQHSRFIFEDIEFSSDFDSGNLVKVERAGEKCYALWVGPDCCGTLSEKRLRTWFYYRVNAQGVFNFTIKNLNLQGKLFRDGMKPLVRTPSRNWERLESSVMCDVKGDVGSFFEVSFSYDFQESPVDFAFSFPWTYADHKEFLSNLLKSNSKAVYIHTETLVYSLERRSCDLVTISGYENSSGLLESEISGLFEKSPVRALRFKKKKLVFISARVHPGETPSSFIATGIINFLTSRDPRAAILRSRFVFKIVPMLNPDGVYRGHFRTDTLGNDLNRQYNSPSITKHPTIFAVKSLLNYYKKKLFMYIDCHAHVSKQGCFVYGNTLDFENQIQNVLFAKLMTVNCRFFSFDACSFNEEAMVKHLKDGSGRVAVNKLYGLTHSYTLECNYHSMKSATGKGNVLGVQEFNRIGEDVCVSLLDLTGEKGEGIDLEAIRLQVSQILTETQPYKRDQEARKASKSIESLAKYIRNCRNITRPRQKILKVLTDTNKTVVPSFKGSTKTKFPLQDGFQLGNVVNLAYLNDLYTRCIVSKDNSFQIRKRNSSFVKCSSRSKDRRQVSNDKKIVDSGLVLL